MIWLTHRSELDTFEALDDRDFEQSGWVAHRTLGVLLGAPLSSIAEELTPEESSPLVRMWYDHTAYLGAIHALFMAERSARFGSPGRTSSLPHMLGLGPREVAVRPAWRDDTDLMRSHRSNLARRFPEDYPESWGSGDLDMWPYIFPFTDEDGEYSLVVSKAERQMLKDGERKLPKSVKERISNL